MGARRWFKFSVLVEMEASIPPDRVEAVRAAIAANVTALRFIQETVVAADYGRVRIGEVRSTVSVESLQKEKTM